MESWASFQSLGRIIQRDHFIKEKVKDKSRKRIIFHVYVLYYSNLESWRFFKSIHCLQFLSTMIVSRYRNTIVHTSPWILYFNLNETKMPRVNFAPLASFDNKIIDSIDSFTNRFPNRVSRSDRKPLRCVSGSRTTRTRNRNSSLERDRFDFLRSTLLG